MPTDSPFASRLSTVAETCSTIDRPQNRRAYRIRRGPIQDLPLSLPLRRFVVATGLAVLSCSSIGSAWSLLVGARLHNNHNPTPRTLRSPSSWHC